MRSQPSGRSRVARRMLSIPPIARDDETVVAPVVPGEIASGITM
ncbi:hypothetical protein BV133_2212 [Blastochloris viridis]|uniref:Uncharacterized protein n=1 Tax=Blastochloris viridis TaxID=1079 RepID=A0A182D307_BLAVI|nr:hypothetical protein BV133_2212 [Blastochloris viridis]